MGLCIWRFPYGRRRARFPYLLPRILDLSINDPGSVNDTEIVLGKLRLALWRSWSATEQEVIEALLDAWFELALARDLAALDDDWSDLETERVLCGAVRAGFPIAPWLLRLHEPVADPALADLRDRYPNQLSPFWDLTPDGFAELSTIFAQGAA